MASRIFKTHMFEWHPKNAPLIPQFERILDNTSRQRKRMFYQILVFFVTFIAYVFFHMNNRTFSVIKDQLAPNCNITTVNNTCHPWAPFGNHRNDGRLFGYLDFTFMMTFSISLFVSGHVAENTNLRIYLTFGMIMTGATTALCGLAKYLGIHSLPYFFLVQVLGGMMQSTGFPCVTEAFGMWFAKGYTGITYGIWSLNSIVGNTIGYAIAGHFATTDWGLSFVVPAIIITCCGFIVYFILIPDPKIVNCDIHDDAPVSFTELTSQPLLFEKKQDNKTIDELSSIDIIQNESVGISIWSAWKIPGVIEYALCTFFIKLVLYTFYFWMPYYIHIEYIEGHRFPPNDANYYSVLFDIGGGVGGILAGIVFDYTDAPATICVIMLIITAPCLYMFIIRISTIPLFLSFMFTTGCFLNGPFTVITTMVAAKLGSHESLEKNVKAIAVLSAIFNGCGSIGAAIGPLLAGVIASAQSWDEVSYLMMIFVLVAAIILVRQFFQEAVNSRTKYQLCMR